MQRDVFLLRQIHFRTMQRHALRYLNLRPHNVNAGDHFRHRMFHLYARIHFNEEPFAGIGIHQEFHSARVVVTGGTSQFHGSIGQFTTNTSIQVDRRGHFHNFLMTALHGTIPFMQVQNVPVLIAQNLNFHMACATDIAFHKATAIPKSSACFTAGFVKLTSKVFRLFYNPHAPATTAEGSLNDQRKANAGRQFPRFHCVGNRMLSSGHHRDASFFSQGASCCFITQLFQKVGTGSNKCDAVLCASSGQGRIF